MTPSTPFRLVVDQTGEQIAAEEEICSALTSSRHANSNVRAHIGRTLQQADTRTVADPRIVDALAALRSDADPDVRAAASWSDRP